MRIKQVVLHVGMHKTGTTSIQNTLFNVSNVQILSEMGYVYLAEWGANQSVTIFTMFGESQQNEYFKCVHGISDKTIEKVKLESTESLKALAAKSTCEKLLISGEDICVLSEESLYKLKTFFIDILGKVDFRVVLYVRSPLSYYISTEQTLIVGGSPSIELQYNHFRDRIGKFIKVFGRNIIEIYRFEDALSKQFCNPVAHFLKVLGFSKNDVDKFKLEMANESQCHIVVEILRYLNERVPSMLDSPLGYISNPLRMGYNITPLLYVKGPKYDYTYEQKTELSIKLINDTKWLKSVTGIDYMPFLKDFKGREFEYDSNTINDIGNVFFDLSEQMRRICIDFFELKYLQTCDIGLELLISKIKTIHQISTEFKKILGSSNAFSTPIQEDYVQLFIDYGTGFNEQDSIKYPMPQQKIVEINLNLDASRYVTNLRIDPSYFFSIVLLEELLINGESDNYQIVNSNYFDCLEKFFIFLQDDPQIHIVSNEIIESLNIRMIVDVGFSPFSFTEKKFISKILINKISEYEERINMLENELYIIKNNNGSYVNANQKL